ncbi:MAG: phospho-sugar mutase [Tannerellaceae bacterium]|jgi:phosphoglucomutase|nr:phospho-sugar mutase [Tannerellaceae bacterium]
MDDLLLNVRAKAREWLSELFDEQTREQVHALMEHPDPAALIEAFYRNLEFGTGGLRGIMGVGTNRMNIYTVGAAAQGFANYLRRQFGALTTISVVIGYDNRNNSRLFAQTTADVFSANDIHVHLFDDLRPTPEVSFAIRSLAAQGGVMITASHNTKEYNGFKVYWDDGAQIVTPHDTLIVEEIKNMPFHHIRFQPKPAFIHTLGQDMDAQYIRALTSLSLSHSAIHRQRDLKIVYTPIHGAGVHLVPQTLTAFGFANIIPVPEQMRISGDFPTVVSPNPEDPAALQLAIQLAQETNADLVLATDPDGDRIAAATKDHDGNWFILNGNQAAILFTWYILKRRSATKAMRKTDFMVKTIVTSETMRKIAEQNGVRIFDVFTGFKWIADIIRHFDGKRQFVGGGEESFGFLWQDFVRDKDGVSAAALFAEITAWGLCRHWTLYDLLEKIYTQYGYSKEVGFSLVRDGKQGLEEIAQLMKSFRLTPPAYIAGSKVTQVKDFAKIYPEMPAAATNVIQYFTDDDSKISIRPSGTEPKIKFYIEIHIPILSPQDIPQAEEQALQRIDAIRQALNII